MWLAIETAIIFVVYPETKGPTLEELGECKSAPVIIWYPVGPRPQSGFGHSHFLVFENENPPEQGLMKQMIEAEKA